MPGTSGFVGEFLIVLGLFNASPVTTVFAVFSIIFTAVYSIWFFNRLVFGVFGSSFNINYSDLSNKELLISVLFCVLVIFFGLSPQYFIQLAEVSIYYLMMKS